MGWAKRDVEDLTLSELIGVVQELHVFDETYQYQEWQRFAFLASVFANIFRKKGSKKYKPEDFIRKPDFKPPKLPKVTLSELIREAKMLGLQVPEKEVK